MPRKKRASLKREIAGDPKYHAKLVTRFVNVIMWDGKKSTAEKVVYQAFDRISLTKKDDPVKIFKQALENLKPVVEVRSRRVGGANYQVPIEVPQRRARTLAVRWLVSYARDRREKAMVDKLAGEIMDALNSQGGAFKKKDDLYRMAQANKAFAHYRW